MNKLFPDVADNNYMGAKSAYYFFIFWMLLNTWRSFVHFTTEDAGLNSIANLIVFEGTPDPNQVIYLLGSLWGEVQVLLCLVSWVILLKYRSLLSFMYLIWLLEWLLRITLISSWHGLDDSYRTAPTPGAVYAPYIAGLLAVFFALSLRKVK